MSDRVPMGPATGGPSPEELLDYLEGRLAPEEEAALRRRLVASPDATRDLLSLAELSEAGAAAELADEPGAAADFEVRAGWRDFQRRASDAEVAEAAEEGESAPEAGRAAPVRIPSRGAHRGLVALAATLFVAVLALAVWNRQLRLAAGPDEGVVAANVRTLELFDDLRSDEVPEIGVGPGESFRVALFAPGDCARYRAEVAGPSGPAGTADDLEPDAGLLTFLFRGAPGAYTLHLFGCEPEREISAYGFEISRSPSATSRRNEAPAS